MSLRTIQYATNMNEKYFYTFRINQITFTYGERKKERPNFYGMFSQNLLNSAAFASILKMKLPQCNPIRVRTLPGCHGIQIHRYKMVKLLVDNLVKGQLIVSPGKKRQNSSLVCNLG